MAKTFNLYSCTPYFLCVSVYVSKCMYFRNKSEKSWSMSDDIKDKSNKVLLDR